MKTKLTFLVVLFASQTVLMMVAAQEPWQDQNRENAGPEHGRQTGVAAWLRKKAAALGNALCCRDSLVAERDEQPMHLGDADDSLSAHNFIPPINPSDLSTWPNTCHNERPTAYDRSCRIYSIDGKLLLDLEDDHSREDQYLFRPRALAFVLVNHPHCGARSPFYGLPDFAVQQICSDLKKPIGLPCKLCNVVAPGVKGLFWHYHEFHCPQSILMPQ